MKKSLIALAVLGSFAGVAAAQSSLTIYGIIDLGLVKQNRAEATIGSNQAQATLGGVGFTNKELNVAQSTKSRIGFRGEEDLGGGLSAKFDLEHRLYPDTGATNTSGGNQFWDKSIVALTSQSLGEIALGRDYGPTFYSQYMLDPWLNQGIAEVGGTTYAFAGYTQFTGHNARYNNGLWYKAKFGGFTGMLSTSLSETQGRKHRFGAGVMFNEGPLFVTASYDQDPSAVDTDEKDTLFIVGAAYDFGVIKPRVQYAQSKLLTPFGGEVKPRSFTVAATMPMGSGLFKVGYTQLNWKGGNPIAQAVYAQTAAAAAAAGDAGAAVAAVTAGTAAANGEEMKQRKISLGYEYAFSKRTAAYVDLTSGKTKNSTTVSGADVGIRHSF